MPLFRNRHQGSAMRGASPFSLKPSLWVGVAPNGVGQQKPNHFGEMAKTVWENRKALPYAYRILSQGVCDGCALGVAGFHDWTLDGVHLCTTRLNLLKVNTMGPVHPSELTAPGAVESLRQLDGRALRELGRVPFPMRRRHGEDRFTQVSWDEALGLVSAKLRDSLLQDPAGDRMSFYLTARGLTNESYYVAQKAVRAIGSPHIDNAARVCHAPSGVALKRTIGVAATTCSYTDVLDTDLVILFGSDVANGQPVFTKYLYLARRNGAKVVVVNPFVEPGIEKYWVPSNAESALFGTKLMTDHFAVHTGGDQAFVQGVLKVLAEKNRVDSEFISAHTTGWEALRSQLEATDLSELARRSGASVADIERFAELYAAAKSAVIIWSMGITQHAFGTDNVCALVNLALARGNVGRPGAGLMPIRGHSGVQGGAEMGAYATALPNGLAITEASALALSEQYGFSVPPREGRTAEVMVEAGGRGELDVLFSSGGNFLDVLPDPAVVRHHLEQIPMRVHLDIVMSTQMLIDAPVGGCVVVLPAATRYEQRDGGTETTTERRIAYSPEIAGPRPGEVKSEWEVFAELATLTRPEHAKAFAWADGFELRTEIAKIVPSYDGIQHLRTTGDQVQWGGTRLCEGGNFPTDDARGRFTPLNPPDANPPEGKVMLSTRRGKQFNSMVWQDVDPLTGAGRRAVFLNAQDAVMFGVVDGEAVIVRSDHGEVPAVVHLDRIKQASAQMFFPEANPLFRAGEHVDASEIPEYTALVEVVKAQ